MGSARLHVVYCGRWVYFGFGTRNFRGSNWRIRYIKVRSIDFVLVRV